MDTIFNYGLSIHSTHGYSIQLLIDYSNLWIWYSIMDRVFKFMDTLFSNGYSIQLWIEYSFSSKIQYSVMDRLFKFMDTVFKFMDTVFKFMDTVFNCG